VHTDVNPVRVRRDRDINAVIDKEQGSCGLAAFAQGNSQIVHLAAPHALRT
jgi:hypothetical protein